MLAAPVSRHTAPVRIGVQLNPQHADYPQIRRACRAFEEAGADIVFNWDHFWPRRYLEYLRRRRRLRPQVAHPDEHCARIGRDPALIERSVLIGGDPAAVGEPLLANGARLFILGVNPPYDLRQARRWIAWRDDR